MNNIKVNYKELVDFLTLNKNKKVSTLMPNILAMVTSKTTPKTFKCDDKGKVTHIFCYYHKEWEDITLIEYGAKKSSSTGYNTMCKEGVSNWSKQQRKSKQDTANLLDSLANAKIDIKDLQVHKDAIEQARTTIIPRSDNNNANTQDEA